MSRVPASSQLKPIYLFADSRPLFLKGEDGLPFLIQIKQHIRRAAPKAAYLGASNGENQSFYGIFEAAMEGIGIKDCRMIKSSYTDEDASFLDDADIIFLSGGDVERGWRIFEEFDLRKRIIRRYYEGAILIGVSAGAVQIGLFGLTEKEDGTDYLFSTFGLVPFIVGVHEERRRWLGLQKSVLLSGGEAHGIGIGLGGGAIYHADHYLEPIHLPVIEYMVEGQEMLECMLFPDNGNEVIDCTEVC